MNKLMNFCFYMCTLFFILIVLFVGFLIGEIIYTSAVVTNEVTVTVTSVDRANDQWMVLGLDEEGEPVSFINKDSLLHRKFNSSDVQAAIEPGETYRFLVCGKRIPLISQYQNILKILPPESSP